MNHFDLFLQASDNFSNSGISTDTKNYYRAQNNINFYVLDEPVYSISNIMSPSNNKYQIIRFINLNAKEYQKYRDVSQTTEISDDKDEETSEDRDQFLSRILHTFICNVESKFSSSNAIREVMMSSSASVFICVLLTNKEDYKYKVVGGCYYTCSPLFGVLVPLMIVNEQYHKKGLGSNFLRSIQKYTTLVLKNRRCLVWFTYDENNTLLAFYRKLGFHPAISINLPIEHCLPLSLITEINTLGTHEYLIECLDDISLENKKHEIPAGATGKNMDRTCEICGLQSKFVLVCQHTLKNSSYKLTTKAKKSKGRNNRNKEICGIQVCFTCNSQFGISPEDEHCVFHAEESVNFKYTFPTANITKASSLYSQKHKISKKIHNVYQDTIEMAMRDKAKFYTEFFESFDTRSVKEEIKCKHCFMRKNEIQHQCFQCLIPLQPQTQENRNSWTHLKHIVNNQYDFKNQYEMKNLGLHQSKKCPVSSNVSHNLAFDDNIGRPSTLLQNCIFGIKNVYGFGDCGVLSLLLPMLSVSNDMQQTIYRSMHQVYKTYRHTHRDSLKFQEIFSVKGIRSILFYAKINTGRGDENYDFEGFPALEDFYQIIQELREDEENNHDELNGCIEGMREQFAITYEDQIHHDSIYWLTDSDMMNLISASDGLICVLGVTESTVEVEKNQFRSIIHDFNYYFTFQKHILKEAKNFILLRHIDGQHYDYFYDRRNKCALFEIDLDQKDSIVNYILQYCSPTQYYQLTGKIKETTVQFGNEVVPFYLEQPTLSEWKETHEVNSAKRMSYNELKEIQWIQDILNNSESSIIPKKKKNRNPIILFHDIFKEDPCLSLLLYVEIEPTTKKVTFFDLNHYEIDSIKMEILCSKFKKDLIDLENVQLYDVASIPKKEDILLCEQFLSHQIFLLKVHNTGEFINQFYSDHFGSCDVFSLRRDEDFLQHAFLTLSKIHDNVAIKRQMYSLYMMMRENKKEQMLYFGYFYNFDMKGKPEMFQKWFYRTNPDFCLKYQSEKDFMWYTETAKDFDHKCLYYQLLDLSEINTFWKEKYAKKPTNSKQRKLNQVFENLERSLNEKFPQIPSNKARKSLLNSVKWLSFFQHQDNYSNHDKTTKDWTVKKIMGFYLLSCLMEHDGNQIYSFSNMKNPFLEVEELNRVRDCLLFHCGYSKEEITTFFNLNTIPKQNTKAKAETNKNSKSKRLPKSSQKVTSNKKKKDTIPSLPAQENKNLEKSLSKSSQKITSNEKKKDTISSLPAQENKNLEIILSKLSPKITSKEKKHETIPLLPAQENINLEYARYVIDNKDSTSHKIYKITDDEKNKFTILQLQQRCRMMGTLIHPESNTNKKDRKNTDIYRKAHSIALSAAQRMLSEKFKDSTEIDKDEIEVTTEIVEDKEKSILTMLHATYGDNQQAKQSKEKNDQINDSYFHDLLSVKMKYLSKMIQFQNQSKKPFEYETFDLQIQHKELQATSIFIYDRINLLQTPFQGDDDPTLNLNNETSMLHSDLWRFGKDRWLNDSNIFGATRLFQNQFPTSDKIKIFEPQFYTLAATTDYNRLSSIFFHTKMRNRHEKQTLETQKEFFHQYEILLIPVNITNNHWYLIYMHLKEKKVYVIDSLSSQGNRKNEVLFLLSMLCTIVESKTLTCELFTAKYWSDNNTIEVSEFPQQKDGYNCGIFVLMTIYQVLRHQSLKKLFHPSHADKFREYVYALLVNQHFEYGGTDQTINENESSVSVIDIEDTNVDSYVQLVEISNNDSEQYIANLLETEPGHLNIVDEIIQVPIELKNQMKFKYFKRILELVELNLLKKVQRGDVMELQPSTGSDGAFIQFDTNISSFLYPDFGNYNSIYTAASSLNRYRSKYLSLINAKEKNEATKIESKHNDDSQEKLSENQEGNHSFLSHQTIPDTITSKEDESIQSVIQPMKETTEHVKAEISQIVTDKESKLNIEGVRSKVSLMDPIKSTPFDPSDTESTYSDQNTKPSSSDIPTKTVLKSKANQSSKKNKKVSRSKPYLPMKRPKTRKQGKSIQTLSQVTDFDIDDFEITEESEEPRQSLIDILFDCSDLESNNNQQHLLFKKLLQHFDTCAIPKSKIAEEVVSYEEDHELRETFKDDNGNFSLSHTVDYFINQFRMKFLTSIKESKEESEPGEENESLYYYVSRCNKVRRELVGWDIFTPDVYSGINSTFAHKWMTQPFPKLYSRKHKKYRRFNDVEKEVHQFWKKWKNYKKISYKWFLMTPGMRKQYQVLNRRDFRKIIETFCPIQMIKYIQAKDKYYGEYYFESKKIYFVELDNEFFEKNTTLIRYKLAAKDKSGVSIALEHGSCASSITSKNTTVNENRNANCYPKIQFQQGKNETCIERSMNSVLWFWLNNCTFDKPTKEKDRIKKMIGKVIKEIDIGTKNTYGKTKLKKINSILLNDNFFSCEKFPKNIRKKEREMRRMFTLTYCRKILIKEILRCVNYVGVTVIKITQSP